MMRRLSGRTDRTPMQSHSSNSPQTHPDYESPPVEWLEMPPPLPATSRAASAAAGHANASTDKNGAVSSAGRPASLTPVLGEMLVFSELEMTVNAPEPHHGAPPRPEPEEVLMEGVLRSKKLQKSREEEHALPVMDTEGVVVPRPCKTVSNTPTPSVDTADSCDVFERAAARERDGWVEAENISRRGGCCGQLGNTILRVLILMKREWCSTACELLIPIIFVIGSVVLWAVFGTSSAGEGSYFSETSTTNLTQIFSAMPSTVCANPNVTNTLVGVQPCLPNTAALLPATLTCPVARGIPTGLCYYSSIIPLAAAVEWIAKKSTSIALPLDTLIPMQWAARDEDTFGTSTSFSYGGLLYFAPNTNEVQSFIAKLNSSSALFQNIFGGIYDTADEAKTHVQGLSNLDPPTWAIVTVNSFTSDAFDVSIMMNQSSLPQTKSTFISMYLGGLSDVTNGPYVLSGYTTLQSLLYDHYLTTVLGQPAMSNLSFTPMPTPAYSTHSFLTYGPQLAPLILVLGYLYPVSQQTKRIVVEKELRIREAMLIMGLSEWIMYLAWMLVYGAWHIVSSAIITVILRFTYLPHTSGGYMFFMFLFFSWSTITLSGAIAGLFSKARLAALLAPLIYFVMAIPLFAMQTATAGAKTGIMILSPSALSVGFAIVFEHEALGGTDASALVYFRDSPKLILVFVFLVIDIFLYLLLMLYFDSVIPKDWGTTKHPLFFIIDPIKWCCCRREANGQESEEDRSDREDGRAEDGVFEETDSAVEKNAAVQIRGLRKRFKRGGKSFLAVNNLYWSLRQGQISVLLGHNGAGKSTTMNLMTGMLEPDEGDCYIYGQSIRHQLAKARQEIGLCPQHNILWPNLTVREHLDYYAAIKGLSGAEKEAAIQRLLTAVDLQDKEFYLSKALSGGQKRKLSVAVAFVGGSRLIFLDEPTAGMDVGARRHTWSLLKEMTKYHTILLSTHFMDEADLLGDTVAIMSNGRLQCSGSNMFLKSHLGIGFVLTMSVAAHTRREAIDGMVRTIVSGAETVGSGAGELSYRLPMASKTSFPELLAAVEEGIPSMGINAYSLSATTLEEVFIKIAEGPVVEGDEERLEEEEKAAATSAVWNVELETRSLTRTWLQFRAMMVKRFWNALRDHRTQFFQIICPVLCVLLAMLLTLVKIFQFPDLTLTSTIYDTTVDEPLANCDGVIDTTTPFASNVNMQVLTGAYTGTTFSDELRSTFYTHTNDRYGGLTCAASASDLYHHIFYNTTSYHELAIGTANFFAGQVRKITSSAAPEMRTVVGALPNSKQDEAVQSSIYSLMIAVIIMIPFTFIPSTFVGWIVKERECKARHLQNVSGLSFYVYWFSNFLFDICCYIITMFLVIAVFGIFRRHEYIDSDNIGATIVVFFLYGVSGILMAYALSFLFDSHSTAQNVVMLANFIVGFLFVLAVSALNMMEKTKSAAKILRWIFRLVPCYCVGEGISNLATLQVTRAYGIKGSAWDMDVVGWLSVYMALEVPFFLFLTLFIDHPGRRQRSQRLFHNPNATPEEISDEDEDVVREREDVLESPERESDLVRVTHLRKEYANGKVAVRNITLGVKPGEVFGFLGTNGAGKTTTISILCQEFYPTSGRAYICGHDIVAESAAALRCIGYCPQFDACLDLLTVEEHLYLYAGVRGISSRTKETVVAGLTKLCGLTEYRKTKSHELSGGNRRKLSVAISLIGGPRVVFFDEPSAGMDPVARRGLWNAIETVADNCSVVLTTHHLEEVEALAHRVAIMVDGTLRCIGDKTHLKQKYGTGFEVTVRVADESDPVINGIKDYFADAFPSSELTEMRAGRFTYQLPNTVKLSAVFTSLEDKKEALRIRDYNVSQTSIEQVFMRISEEAELQQEEEHRLKQERKKESCCMCRGGCCGSDE